MKDLLQSKRQKAKFVRAGSQQVGTSHNKFQSSPIWLIPCLINIGYPFQTGKFHFVQSNLVNSIFIQSRLASSNFAQSKPDSYNSIQTIPVKTSPAKFNLTFPVPTINYDTILVQSHSSWVKLNV